MMQQLLRLDISFKVSLTWKIEKMDGFTEKKWFVYLGDHHEGPFSLEEIQGKMSEGRVTRENYVWADGMADWQPMPQVPDFNALLLDRSQSIEIPSLSIHAAPSP